MQVSGRLLPQLQPVQLSVRDGVISEMEPTSDEQVGDQMIARGFLDIQVNGYRGMDYSGDTLSIEDVRAVTRALLASGTTRHLPTIITNSQERIERNLATIASAVESDSMLRFAVPGIHVEGPFISSEDGPRGAHDPRFVRPPSVREIERWIEASNGLLSVVTLAPELEGVGEAIRFMRSKKIQVALGHHAGSADDIESAVEAGARLSTHLGNGSHAQLPRLNNYIWHQLGEDRLSASLIADGFHIPKPTLRVFARAKGRDRIVLVSDVAPIAGQAPGTYKWGNMEIAVHEDGHVGLAGTPYLAGAGHLLDHSIATFARATGWSIASTVDLATRAPYRFLGWHGPSEQHQLAPGDPADFIVFRWPNENKALSIDAVHTPAQGQQEFRRTPAEGTQ